MCCGIKVDWGMGCCPWYCVLQVYVTVRSSHSNWSGKGTFILPEPKLKSVVELSIVSFCRSGERSLPRQFRLTATPNRRPHPHPADVAFVASPLVVKDSPSVASLGQLEFLLPSSRCPSSPTYRPSCLHVCICVSLTVCA